MENFSSNNRRMNTKEVTNWEVEVKRRQRFKEYCVSGLEEKRIPDEQRETCGGSGVNGNH